MRPLTFGDDKDNEQEWRPDDDTPAIDAFMEFVDRHRDRDNQSFNIEDENDEGILFLFEVGAVVRVAVTENTRAEYRLVTDDGDHRTLAENFIRGGFAGLDRDGPWLPDVPSLARARIRHEFEGSVLRRTHPRELRRRLEVLTHADGRTPTTTDGVTHFGFAGPGGGSVNAWFGADGRGVLVTFDRDSDLNEPPEPDALPRADVFDGVPNDILTMVRDNAKADATLNVTDPDGRAPLPATGVFHFSGPCSMSDGLVSRLQDERLDLGDTGLGWLLEGFLEITDFTPETVARTVPSWRTDDIARGFAAVAARRDERPPTPLDRESLDRFRRIRDDHGRNDRWDVHYVLFEGDDVEDAGGARDEALRLIETLGLDRVDSPPNAAPGEVWVLADPRVDAEPGRRS